MGATRLLWLLAMLSLAACAAVPQPEDADVDRREVAGLARGILALGEGIDPEEAERAARIAYEHTRVLAREYRITDPPLIHNTKVNMGLRPRGLCWHWAEDIEARLLQENFRTLELHRAIAPPKPLQLEHSTAIISRRGDSLHDGMVLDPWRKGGVLHWVPTRADTRYDWRPRRVVMAERAQAGATRRQGAAMLHVTALSPLRDARGDAP